MARNTSSRVITIFTGRRDLRDNVIARGQVFGAAGLNDADLAFNYQGSSEKPLELEVLHYADGPNWMSSRPASVSHLGMHCNESELGLWTKFFSDRGIGIAQQVQTLVHTNPVIANKRFYRYTIFDTREILGVDIKFIVRRDVAAC